MLTKPLHKSLTRSLVSLAVENALASFKTRSFIPFDSVAQTYMPLISPITLDGDFEIRLLVSSTIGNKWQCLLSGQDFRLTTVKEPESHIRIDRVGEFTLEAPDGSFPANGDFIDILVHRKDSTISVYLDGLFKGSASSHLPITISHIATNEAGNGSADYFDGFIAGLKIWTGGDRNTGTLVVDMPMDKKLTLENPVVENNVATYGPDLFESFAWSVATPDNGSVNVTPDGIELTRNSNTGSPIGYHISDLDPTKQYVVRGQISGAGNGTVASWDAAWGNPGLTHIQPNVPFEIPIPIGSTKLRFENRGLNTTITFTDVQVQEVTGIIGTLVQFDPAEFQDWTEDSELNQWHSEELFVAGNIDVQSDWTDNGDGSYNFNRVVGHLLTLQSSPIALTGTYKYEFNYTHIAGSGLRLGSAYIQSFGVGEQGKHTVIASDVTRVAFKGNGEGAQGIVSDISLKAVLQLPELPQDVIGRERYMTNFDSVAQTHTELSSRLNLNNDYEIEFWAKGSTAHNSKILGANDESNGAFTWDADGDFLICSGGWRHVGTVPIDGKLHRFVIKVVSNVATLHADGIYRGQSTLTTLLPIDYIGLAYIHSTLVEGAEGIITGVRIWTGGDRDTGTLVLDMPIDQQYTLANPVVMNDAAVLGPELATDLSAPSVAQVDYSIENGVVTLIDNVGGKAYPNATFYNKVLDGSTLLVTVTIDTTQSASQGFFGVGNINDTALERIKLSAGKKRTITKILKPSGGTGISFYIDAYPTTANDKVVFSDISVREIPADTPLGTLKQFDPAEITYQQYDDDYRGWWGESVYNFNTAQGDAVNNGDDTYTFGDSYGRIQDWQGAKYVGTTLLEFDYVGEIATVNVDGLSTYTVADGKFSAVLVNPTAPDNFDIDIWATSGNTVTISNITARKLLELP